MLFLAQCANQSYNNAATIQNWLTDKGFTVNDSTFHFDGGKTGIEYFIIATGSYIVIAFRGSELSIEDWKTNADAFKNSWVRCTGVGRVHGGFENGLTSIWQELYSNLLRLRNNNQSIWITGHSQGGALAVLAASKLYHQNRALSKAVYGIYTFGQPRIGNPVFAKSFDRNWSRKCFRVVNHNDIVTRLPSTDWNYRHVGKLVYFDGRGKLRAGRGKGRSRWQRMWDSVRGKYKDSIGDILFDQVTDHFMDNYVELCQKHLKLKKHNKV